MTNRPTDAELLKETREIIVLKDFTFAESSLAERMMNCLTRLADRLQALSGPGDDDGFADMGTMSVFTIEALIQEHGSLNVRMSTDGRVRVRQHFAAAPPAPDWSEADVEMAARELDPRAFLDPTPNCGWSWVPGKQAEQQAKARANVRLVISALCASASDQSGAGVYGLAAAHARSATRIAS